jgi:phage protein D
MRTRRTDIAITYQGTNITADLKPYLKSFTYTDPASGEADTISLDIADMDRKWLDAWFPTKTDSISASIMTANWNGEGDNWTLDCGSFTVDTIGFSGSPVSMKLDAISQPVSQSFDCRKNSKTWEKTTIQGIASKISADAGVSLVYEASAISIEAKEQSEEEDMKFLQSLCDDYGLAMKIYNSKIILFAEEQYEAKASVRTLTELDVISWSGQTTLTGLADSVEVKYKDPKTSEDLSYTYQDPKKVGRPTYKLQESNEKADSIDDARKKAKAELRAANREETTLSLKIDPHKGLTSAMNVDVTGFGKFDGKYFIDKITHNISGGYTMDLEMRRVA